MSVLETTADQKKAYRWARHAGYGYGVYQLADALQVQCARALKAEFELAHRFCVGPHYVDIESDEIQPGCHNEPHNWTDAEWLAEADRKLREP